MLLPSLLNRHSTVSWKGHIRITVGVVSPQVEALCVCGLPLSRYRERQSGRKSRLHEEQP
eukprot:3477-Eustigmatos_ZCMA.PRE.1